MNYSNYFWQGKQVRLRPLRVEDAEPAFQNLFDSPGRQLLQLGVELPTTLENMRETLAKRANCADLDGIIVFAIENDAEEIAGGVSFHSRDLKNGSFSFGIAVYAPFRGRGYAFDAVRILLKYGFWEQRYQKCNSACIHTNQGSIRLHHKLGFKDEGCRRCSTFFNGQYYDDLLFGLTRAEFDETMKDN